MSLNRDRFIRTSAAAVAGLSAGAGALGTGFAADESPIGTFPGGVGADAVFVGLCCPLTGSYGADGEDLRKGYVLALSDLNNGTGVMGMIPSLRGHKGVLGKRVDYKTADTETNPNTAVQHATEFITQNKAIMITGGVASSEVIAMGKAAQQQKVLFMTGASGSNDTTGVDCQRYMFRSQCDAYMVAKAIAPILAKALGTNRKAVYLTPDYSYGHSLTGSMREFTEKLGWTTVADVVAPFPSSDYSSYLTNVANSGADTFVNIEFGNDGVASTKQAAQFGILSKMKLVVPNVSTYFPDGVGTQIMEGVYGTQEWYFSLADRYPLSKVFLNDFEKMFPGVVPRWTAHIAYTQIALWADAVTRAKTFYPPTVIGTLEGGTPVTLMLGPVHYRAGDHQLVRPVPVVVGKKASAMQGKDDWFQVVDIIPGDAVMQPLNTTMCTMPPVT
jgi:ABC-type branched-subunit amino acid transport system substrate-binding protein